MTLCFYLGCSGLFLCRDSRADQSQDAIQLIQSGHFTEAAGLLQKAVTQHPGDVSLWNLLGISQTEAGQFVAAERAFGRGLTLAPHSAELNENLGLLFFRQAKYVNAKSSLSLAAKFGSTKPGVLFSLAASRLRTGEPAQALAELRALEPALGDKMEYWQERGRAEVLVDPASASDSFDRALALSPNDAGLLNEAAAAAEKQKLDEKALAYLIQARTAAPEDVPTLLHFGSVCIRRDLGPDAHDALAKAHQLQPSNNTALYLLARADISLQNWRRAYDEFEQFSKKLPRFAPAHYAMGWLDIRLNRLDDAHVQLQRALALEPSLSGAAYELAQLELNDGRLDSAEKVLRESIRRSPNDSNSTMLLGDILTRKNQVEEARRLLSTAVEQDPASAVAHYKLSVLLFRMHEPEKAMQEKNIAAKLTEDSKQASKTQLRLILPDTERTQH